jgi:c-di-GMP-binding flagellar brake protein YcgR
MAHVGRLGTINTYIALHEGELMRDRRLGFRIPLDVMVTVYVNDRPLRGLVVDLGDTGLRLDVVAGRAPAPGSTVQLEIELPGAAETLWASGTVRYQRGGELAAGLGIRFAAMAAHHGRQLRDYCVEARHRHLATILARIARPPVHLRAA